MPAASFTLPGLRRGAFALCTVALFVFLAKKLDSAANIVPAHFRWRHLPRSAIARGRDIVESLASAAAALPLVLPRKTLAFQTCNGFANQRLALLYGFVLAKVSDRAVFLPDLVADGTQMLEGDAPVYVNRLATGPDARAFSHFFRVTPLVEALARHGVQVVSAEAAATSAKWLRRNLSLSSEAFAERYVLRFSGEPHVAVSCPLWSVSLVAMEAHEPLLLDVLAALKPASERAELIDDIADKLTQSAVGGGYQALHLRYEEDWYRHCKEWTAIHDGVIRDNCGLLGASALVAKLRSFKIQRDVPLYVAVQKKQLRDASVLDALREAFTVVTKEDVLPLEILEPLSREEAAMLDYYVCLRARTFVGNSVSSFSAMLILERRSVGAVATWYNGGNIPIEEFVPLFRMPWVFTYNNL